MTKLIAMKRILNIIFQLWCLLSTTILVKAADENGSANFTGTTAPAEMVTPITIAPFDINSSVPIPTLAPATFVSTTDPPILSKLVAVQETVMVQMKSLQTILEGDSLDVFISNSTKLFEEGLGDLLQQQPFAIATVILSVANQTLVEQTLQLALEIEVFVSEYYQDDVELNTLARATLDNIAPQLVLDLTATDSFFNSLTSVETIDPTSAPTTASPVETLVPTNTLTDSPTLAPVSFPSITPSISTQVPTAAPITSAPTSMPTLTPTEATPEPTVQITLTPTEATPEPTDQITLTPTEATPEPTDQITLTPTEATPTEATPEPTDQITLTLETFLPTPLPLTQLSTLSPTFTPTIKPVTIEPTRAPVIPVNPTLSPTVAVDPANPPTEPPTSVQSATPTDSPTAAPTTRGLSFFSIQLSPVSREMTYATAETFRQKAQAFLFVRFKELERPIEILEVKLLMNSVVVLNQRRRISLQEVYALRVDMSVQGNYAPYKKDEVVDLSKIALNFFKLGQLDFIKMLQNSAQDVDAVYFANVQSLDVVQELNQSPTSEPQNAPKRIGGLSIGAIIGVAVCGVLLVALMIVLLLRQNRREPRPKESFAPSRNNAPPARNNAPPARNNAPPRNRLQMLTPRKKKTPTSQETQDTGQSTRSESQQRLVHRGSGVSSGDSRFDSDSVMLSDMHSHVGTETVAGADTMSYAYSLDHGIDPSLSSGNTDYYTQNSYQAAGGGAAHPPMEIPMMGGRKKGNGNKISRECFAPPGKLGIVIDTTPEGPVIHKVNPGSPLEGIVWPGDIIIAIDDVDTRP